MKDGRVLKMNKLEEAIEQIKADPSGKVARHASQWLALELMDTKFDDRFCLVISDRIYGKYLHVCFEGDEWNPFIEANHTRALVRKVGIELDGSWYVLKGSNKVVTGNDGDDKTNYACQALRLSADNGQLTEGVVKGWLSQ